MAERGSAIVSAARMRMQGSHTAKKWVWLKGFMLLKGEGGGAKEEREEEEENGDGVKEGVGEGEGRGRGRGESVDRWEVGVPERDASSSSFV